MIEGIPNEEVIFLISSILIIKPVFSQRHIQVLIINSNTRWASGTNPLFSEYVVKVNDLDLSKDLIIHCISQFWEDIVSKLLFNQHIKVFVVLKYVNQKDNFGIRVVRFFSLTSLMTITNSIEDRVKYTN